MTYLSYVIRLLRGGFRIPKFDDKNDFLQGGNSKAFAGAGPLRSNSVMSSRA